MNSERERWSAHCGERLCMRVRWRGAEHEGRRAGCELARQIRQERATEDILSICRRIHTRDERKGRKHTIKQSILRRNDTAIGEHITSTSMATGFGGWAGDLTKRTKWLSLVYLSVYMFLFFVFVGIRLGWWCFGIY